MMCPMLTAVFYARDGKDDPDFSECHKEECAWWDKEHDMCRLCTISEELSSIQWELQELRLKRGG